ncbi:uncharacterized protein LOC121391186 [Gigantopelta aegis]|uniref:uncharacterized protein LOC121391186 n=1 Tax=Gigantopelta aegis TaxID=1735272 RepID=UPI001B88E659|nr:uncharacterized protein LOC121391186 [Gigantopelta aegis]
MDDFAAKIENELANCSICLDVYKEPKTLPCLHSFCQRCLAAHILSSQARFGSKKKGGFLCPICMEFVKVGNKTMPLNQWVTQFKTNFYIQSLIEALKCRNPVPDENSETHAGSETDSVDGEMMASGGSIQYTGPQFSPTELTFTDIDFPSQADGNAPNPRADPAESMPNNNSSQETRVSSASNFRYHLSTHISTWKSDEDFPPMLEDICLLNDGDCIIVSDNFHCCVKAYWSWQPDRGQYKTKDKLSVGGSPSCISKLNETMVIVSVKGSLWKHEIDVLQVIPKLKFRQKLQTSRLYKGLASVSDNLIVASCCDKANIGQIHILDISLPSSVVVLKEVTLSGDSHPGYMSFSSVTTQILISDSGKCAVRCIHLRSGREFNYKPEGPHAFSSPQGISLGSTGELYIVDFAHGRKCIFRVTLDEPRSCHMILQESDGLRCPVSVAVSSDKTLYVAEQGGDIKIFKLRT